MSESIRNIIAGPFMRARSAFVQLKRDKAKKRALALIAELDTVNGCCAADVQEKYKKIEHVREHYSIPYEELGLTGWADLRNLATIAESRWDLQFQQKTPSPEKVFEVKRRSIIRIG